MTPAHTRARRPYFNVPPSQQPLRIRDRRKQLPEPQIQPRTNVLEQLVVVPHGRHHINGLHHQDRQEIRDATHECNHGRLPGDRTPPCGCWPFEAVPDLIPDWLGSDIRAYHEQWGKSARWIAKQILPATGYDEIPPCEQALKLRLQPKIPR